MNEIPSPERIRRRVNGLARDHSNAQTNKQRYEARLANVRESLAVSQQVEGALEHLSQQLFDQLVGQLQQNLTQALQEVLDHPIRLKASQTFKHGAACVEFEIERNGHTEDIMKGQGGAVANILSVGLRLFALATLPEDKHRPFLVLDEQDCWIRPDLVPRLVRVVRDAAKALGVQVIMISHHDTSAFANYADAIYRFHPHPSGVRVELCDAKPTNI